MHAHYDHTGWLGYACGLVLGLGVRFRARNKCLLSKLAPCLEQEVMWFLSLQWSIHPCKEDNTYFSMEMKDAITVRRVKKKKKKKVRHSSPKGGGGGGLGTGGGSLTPSPISSGSSLIFFLFFFFWHWCYRPVLHVPQPSLFHCLISWHGPQCLPKMFHRY